MSHDLNYHRHLRVHLTGKPNNSYYGKYKNSKKSNNCYQEKQYEARNIATLMPWYRTMCPSITLPLVNKSDSLERNSHSLSKKFKCALSLHGNGRKYVDFHICTIKEPTALQSHIWLNTLLTSVEARTSQSFSDDQSCVNAFTAYVPSWRNQELNFGNLVL